MIMILQKVFKYQTLKVEGDWMVDYIRKYNGICELEEMFFYFNIFSVKLFKISELE